MRGNSSTAQGLRADVKGTGIAGNDAQKLRALAASEQLSFSEHPIAPAVAVISRPLEQQPVGHIEGGAVSELVSQANSQAQADFRQQIEQAHAEGQMVVIREQPTAGDQVKGLLYLIPGYGLLRATGSAGSTGFVSTHDRSRIAAALGMTAADLALIAVPVPVGAAASVLTRGARIALPTKLGGGFIREATPYQKVLHLRGSSSSQEVLDASLEARRQLATTGEAKVVVGGKSYTFKGDRLDESLRRANPGAPSLTYTTAPDVAVFQAGGPVPELRFPDGRVKPAAEQFQFRSVGGPVPKFGEKSAFGKTGESPGLVAYADDFESLSVPGSSSTPGGVNYYSGGRELEFGAAKGMELPAVRPVAGAGNTFDTRLYLPEGVHLPGAIERGRTNILTLKDIATRRKLTSNQVATPDEVARAKFGAEYDELTPAQIRQVDVYRRSSSELQTLAQGEGSDAATARQVLADREAFGLEDVVPRGDASPYRVVQRPGGAPPETGRADLVEIGDQVVPPETGRADLVEIGDK